MGLPSSRRAFTLVEILVVIVIIAVLASFIFPMLAGAQRSSRQATSLNNLRQWGGAFTASVGDHDNEMPSDGATGGFQIANEDAWFNRLPEKMSIVPLKKATAGTPDYPKLGVKSPWINPEVPIGTMVSSIPFCYGYNDYLSSTTEPILRITRVTYPARTILMTEKTCDASPAVNPGNIKAWFGDRGVDSPDGICNILFVDGHSEGVRKSVYASDKAVKPGSEEEFRVTPITWLPFSEAEK